MGRGSDPGAADAAISAMCACAYYVARVTFSCVTIAISIAVDLRTQNCSKGALSRFGACAVINTWYENTHVNIYSATGCGQPTTHADMHMQNMYTIKKSKPIECLYIHTHAHLRIRTQDRTAIALRFSRSAGHAVTSHPRIQSITTYRAGYFIHWYNSLSILQQTRPELRT